MKQTNTRRALLVSMLSLLLCVSMLVGSTYAWFTDSASTAVNTIQSGTLDVALEYKVNGEWVSAEGQTLDFIKADGSDEVLWEPGCTYALPEIRVVNKGNLALKYQLAVNGINGDAKLLEVIEFTVNDEEVSLFRGELAEQNEASAPLVLKGHMKEEAGNEYQGLTVEGLGITVFATQLENEYDSFNNQYDRLATVDTVAELNEALAADYNLIRLGANLTLTESLAIPVGKTVAIDLAGCTLSQAYAQTTAYAMIFNQGNLTIEDSVGTGKIRYEDMGAGGEYASNTIRNEGVLTVNGGVIENVSSDAVMNAGYPHAIDCYQGSVTTINGGTVKSANYDSIRMFCNSETLATEVVINGGTIVNRISFQNPNNSTHTPGYGILTINGGDFVTTEGVKGNVRLLNFSRDFSNMKATVTGGHFDKGFYTQDYANCGVTTADWLDYAGKVAVSSSAELAEALSVGGEIVLVSDITLDVASTGFTVPNGKNAKLDLNGHDIMGNGTSMEGVQLFSVCGTLEIVGEGTVSLTNDDFAWNTSYRYTAINIRETGVVTLGEGVNVVCVAGSATATGYGMAYAVDIYMSGELNVNGATLHSNYIAVRCFFGASVVNVNSGSITSTKNNWGIWKQGADSAVITVAAAVPYTLDSNGIYVFA